MQLQKETKNSLILASASPRRKELLTSAGLTFSIVESNVREKSFANSHPQTFARQLAEAKAFDVADQYPESWIIGADTIVVSDGQICNKPADKDDARRMLTLLSGKIHQVMTGYCICCRQKSRTVSGVVTTQVHFRKLTEGEIHWYVDTNEPMDKAGAYGIQGLGVFLVKEISGSYTNVVGLPVCEVIRVLMQENAVYRGQE